MHADTILYDIASCHWLEIFFILMNNELVAMLKNIILQGANCSLSLGYDSLQEGTVNIQSTKCDVH